MPGGDGTAAAGRQRMAPRLLQPRLAQSASTIQQYKGTATARSSSSSPASPWYQRPTVSFFKRFLSVSVELLTLLELCSVVAEQVRRGLSRRQRRSLHSRDSSRPPTFYASRPPTTRHSPVLCVFFRRKANAVGRGVVCRRGAIVNCSAGFRCDTLHGRRLSRIGCDALHGRLLTVSDERC